MTFYKISYCSDTIDGVTSLSGLPAKSQNTNAVFAQNAVSPPPLPEFEAIAEEIGDSNSTVIGVGPPPVPGSEAIGDESHLVMALGEVSPPPVPGSETMTNIGDSDLSLENVAPPPLPDAKSKVTKSQENQS